MVENDKLQQRLTEAQADCRDAKLNLDRTLQMVCIPASVPSALGRLVGLGLDRDVTNGGYPGLCPCRLPWVGRPVGPGSDGGAGDLGGRWRSPDV